MLLLPCENCGFNNAVKSELITFCSNCGKKLANNYASWQVLHPDKTIEEWHEQVCINTEKKRPVNYASSYPPANKTKILLIIAAGFVMAGGIVYYSIKNILPQIKTAYEESRWKKLTYGTLGLYIETPEVLMPYNQELPDDVIKSLQHVEYYKSRNGADINILIANTQYNPDISANIEGSTYGIIDAYKKEKTIQHLVYTQQPIVIGDYNAVQITGTYQRNGNEISFISLIATKASYLYIVNVDFSSKNVMAKDIAQRIVKSVAIRRQSETGY